MKTIELVEWLCENFETIKHAKKDMTVDYYWMYKNDLQRVRDGDENISLKSITYTSSQVINMYKQSIAKPMYIPNTDIVINWDQKYVSVSKDDVLTVESQKFVAENRLSIQTNLL